MTHSVLRLGTRPISRLRVKNHSFDTMAIVLEFWIMSHACDETKNQVLIYARPNEKKTRDAYLHKKGTEAC